MRAMWAFVATALVLGSGCAKQDWIDRTLVTEDVTGSWYGRIAGPVGTGREVVFDLEQQASIVKGNVRFVGGGVTGGLSANRSQPGAIEGAVAGDVFRFRDPKGNLVGELKINGDEMTGQADIGSGTSPHPSTGCSSGVSGKLAASSVRGPSLAVTLVGRRVGERDMRAVLGVIAVAVVFASGCAQKDWIDRTLVTVDVTGVWSGSLRGAQAPRDVQLELKQEGSKVTGTMRLLPAFIPGDTASPIEGNVAGDLFTFHDPRGTLSGELTVGEDEMTGRADGLYGTRGITLRRQSSR